MKRKIVVVLFVFILALSSVGCNAEGNIDSGSIETDAGTESLVANESENASVESSQSISVASNSEESSEPEPPEPDNDWEFKSPESSGMDADRLAQLHEAVAQAGINSIVTVKDGYIIDEFYNEGYDENSVQTLQSGSKSFTGALIGLAIEQGHISGVDAKMSDYLPQVSDYNDAQKMEITIEHLLTHTSGLEWYEWGGNASSWRPFRSSENWVDFILSRPMVAQPGAYFAYTTGGSHLLAAVLQEATGMSALDYGREYVFGPMGMDSVGWGADAQGVMDGGNGIEMTARDAAKFGQLYLDGGRWRGRQILPEEWVERSTERIIQGADNTAAYGYQWWVRTCGNYETYYAMGAGGQFIFVVPELNIVSVITGRSRDTYAPRTYFIDYILAAYI